MFDVADLPRTTRTCAVLVTVTTPTRGYGSSSVDRLLITFRLSMSSFNPLGSKVAKTNRSVVLWLCRIFVEPQHGTPSLAAPTVISRRCYHDTTVIGYCNMLCMTQSAWRDLSRRARSRCSSSASCRHKPCILLSSIRGRKYNYNDSLLSRPMYTNSQPCRVVYPSASAMSA